MEKELLALKTRRELLDIANDLGINPIRSTFMRASTLRTMIHLVHNEGVEEEDLLQGKENVGDYL